MLKTFIIRVTSQIELFKRFFIQFANRLVKSFELVTTNQASLSLVLRNLLGDELRKTSKPVRSGAASETNSLPMERLDIFFSKSYAKVMFKESFGYFRDYFNLRKMIIVSTTSGSVYGLHNEDGSVIWSLYLGDDFEPIHDQFGVSKVPLFIQRGTSHYQFPSEAAVVFNVKVLEFDNF